MATDKEASYSCASDPNFAVICSFLDKFATQCGITYPSFADLQEMLEDTQQVSQVLVDLHIKLLRKARKSFTVDKWEKALAKFCHTYSQQDGWELERFGYKKARLEVKVKLLKVLLETQFDVNSKFKSEVNRLTPHELRIEPLGKDQTGLTYWCQFDPSANVRVYREDVDDETWELVAKDRDGLVQLIDSLSSGEGQQELDNILNEDSNSQEIEKPITDTGQDGSGSEEDDESVEEEEEEDEDDNEASVEWDKKTKHKKDSESLPRNNEADLVKPKDHLSKTDTRSATEEDGNKAHFVAENNVVLEGVATKHLVDETAEEKELKKEKSDLTSSNGIENHINGTNHDLKTQSLENGVSSSSETVNSNSSGADLSLKRDTWHTTRPNSVYFMMPDRDPDPETANILSEMSIRFNEKSLAEDSEDLSKKKIKIDQHSKRKISSQSPEQSDKPISLSKKLKTDLPCSNDLPNAPTRSPEEKDEEEGADDDSEVSEAIEEPVGYVVGPGNGAECEGGNIKGEYEQKHASDSKGYTDLSKEGTPPVEVSEAINEPVLYITGLGSGADCNVGNPEKVQDKESSKDSIVGSTIEEPLRYVQGYGAGIECEVGSPRHSRNTCMLDPSNLSTLGVECSLENMSFEEFKPHFSEVIEEPVMIVQGPGHGYECSTGNPDEENNSVVQDPLTKVNSQDLQNLSDKPKTDINCTDSTSIKKLTEEVVDQNVSSDRSSLSDPQASESENSIDQKSTKSLEIIVPSNDKNKSEIFDENEDSKQLADGKKVKANGISGESSTNEVQPDDNLSMKNENEPESSGKKGAGRKNDMLTNIIEVCLDKANANGNDSSAKYNDLFSAKDLQTPPNKQDIVHKSPNKPVMMEETSKKYKQDSAECVGESKVTTTKPFDDIHAGKNYDKQINERKPSEENSNTEDKPREKKLDSGDEYDIDNLNANEKSNEDNIGAIDESKEEPSVKTDEPYEGKLKSEDENCDKKSNFKEEKGEEISETKHTVINLKGRKSRSNSTNDDIKEDIPVKKIKTEQNTEEPAKRTSKRNSRSTSSSTEETRKPSKSKKVSKEPANVSRVDKSKNEVEDLVKKKSKVDKSESEAVDEVKEKCEVDKSKNKAEDEVKEESKVDKPSKNEAKDEVKEESKVDKSESEAEDKVKEKCKVDKSKSKAEDEVKEESKVDKSKNKAEDEVKEKSKEDKPSKNEAKDDVKEEGKVNKSSKSEAEDEIKEENTVDKSSKKEKQDEIKGDSKVNKSSKNEAEDEEKEEEQEANKKTASLACFSMDAEFTEGPVLGKPPEFKNVNRKRRGSVRMSKSEEDTAETHEEDEVGGKKPRLKGKVKKPKGKLAASKPAEDCSSSEEDNKEDGPCGKRKSNAKAPKKENTNSKAAKESNPKKAPAPKSSRLKSPTKGKSGDESSKESNKKKQQKKVEPAAKKPTSSPRKAVLTPRKTAPKKVEAPQKKGKTQNKEPAKRKGKGKAKNQKSSSQTTPKKRKSVEDKKEDSEEEESEAEEEKDNEQEVDSDSKEEKNDKNSRDSKEKSDAELKDEEGKRDEDEKVDDETQEQKPVSKKPRQRKPGNKKTTLLGLTEWDLYHSKKAEEAVATAAEVSESGRGLRASRRIAQNKIKEQAERRVLEEATIASFKDHKKKKKEEAKHESPKKTKKRKGKIDKASEEEDEYFKEPKDEKGRKRKKRKDQLKFNENRPWQSSSGSSSEEADEEEDHFDMEEDEEDIRKKKIVSDHEFSPESDIEDEDEEYQPVKRARTAKKDTVKEEEKDEKSEDYPCQKCGKPDHPEWILLCDKCDNGYHASCLRPPLMLIPEGDWFCPPCQHADLVLKLRETLRTFERNTKKRENEELRRKRLAYVGISLANVLPTPEKNTGKTQKRQIVSSSEEESESEEESSSSDDEPIYQLRQRRATTQANYRFNDYDDLINSAIQDDMDTGQGTGTGSRGKDMQNIVDAEKKREEEEMEKSSAKDKSGSEKDEEESEEEQGENWRPRVVPRVTALPTLRKKHKKLTDLDNVSDDDSDEDFKGSSDDEDFSSSGGDSEDSIAIVPVRRSERARQSRIDKDFINDNSDSSDEPRKKKTRKLFASSSSDSSEGWGRRKKKSKSFSRIRSSRPKKKNKYFDSDSDRPKKSKSKRPKVKYGLSEDEDDMPKTRTRGKKVSYKQLQGTDSEEEMRRRHRKISSEDEDDEEFVPDKDEEEEEKNPSDEKEDSGSQEEESEEDSSEGEKQIRKKEQSLKKENDEKTLSQDVLTKTMEPEDDTASPVKIPSEPLPGSAIKKPVSPSKGALNTSDCDDEVEEEEIEEEVEEEVEEEEEEEIEEDEPPKKSAEQPPHPPKEAAVPKLRVVSPSELMGKKLSTNPEVPPMMSPNQISLSGPPPQGAVILPGPSNLQPLNSGPQRAGPHNPSPMARTQMGIGRQQPSVSQSYPYPPATSANLPYDPLARHPYPSGQYSPNRPPPGYPQGHPRLPGPQSGHLYGQPPMPRYPPMPTSAPGHAIPATNVPAHLQRPPGPSHYPHPVTPPEGRTPHYGPPGGHPRAPSNILRLPPQISVSVTGHPQPAVSSAGGHNQPPSSSSSQHGYPIARHSLPPVSAPGPNHIAMAAVRPPVSAPGYGPQPPVSGPPKQIPSRPHMPGPQPPMSAPGYPQSPMSTMSHAQSVGSYPPSVGHHQPPHSTANQPQTSSVPHHPSQTPPSMYPQPPSSVESTSKAQLTSPEVSQQSKPPPGSSQSTTTAPIHPQPAVSTTSQPQVTPQSGHPQPPTPGHHTQSAGPSSNQNQTPESTTSNLATSAPDEKPNIPINKPPQLPVSTSGQPQPPVGSTQTQSDNAQSLSSESNKSPEKTVSSSTPSVEVIQKSETEEQKVNVIKEEIEGEKKEQVPAIRLVSTAKLLDPSKAGRQRLVSPEEGMMRSGGLHGPSGGGPFYRPPPRLPPPPPGPPGPGYGRQRYPDHRTFPIYQHQPGLPPSSHGYYPQPSYYPSPTPPEEYRPPGLPSGGNYEEPVEQGPTPQPAQSQAEPGSNESEGGVFGGLVSYFSSQREDDIDS